MRKLSKKELNIVLDHNFTKELKDFEYETKFTVNDKKLTSFGVLRLIRSCFINSAEFTLCKIKGGDKLLTTVQFFIGKNTEYSKFLYRGAKMIKVKRHKIIKGNPFSIFKNDESLIIDKTDFNTKLNDLRYRFKRHNHTLANLDEYIEKLPKLRLIGKMTKERVKDFVIDNEDGRIYAVAVSFCTSNGVVQKQLEIEYSGYLPSFKRPRIATEEEVIEGVQAVSNYIYLQLPKLLTPSIERKFSFVQKAKK